MSASAETYHCTLCDATVEKPHLSGKTLIGKILVPYHLCYKCFIEVPTDSAPPMRGKIEDVRKEFWDKLKEKLKFKNRYSV